MENLLDNLKRLFQKDERLVSLPAEASAQAGEGEILKNRVIELALKLDKNRSTRRVEQIGGTKFDHEA